MYVCTYLYHTLTNVRDVRGYATRMTAGAWWFFTLIMVSTYTANLAAFLTTESSDRPFNDVYDLIKKADKLGIKYGAKAKGATEAFFRVKDVI